MVNVSTYNFFATKCTKIITKVLKIVTYCIITESAI